MPTVTGSRTSLSSTRITRLFQVTKENTSTDTTRTISRKLVPHRGWNRVYFFTFSGVSSSPAS